MTDDEIAKKVISILGKTLRTEPELSNPYQKTIDYFKQYVTTGTYTGDVFFRHADIGVPVMPVVPESLTQDDVFRQEFFIPIAPVVPAGLAEADMDNLAGMSPTARLNQVQEMVDRGIISQEDAVSLLGFNNEPQEPIPF